MRKPRFCRPLMLTAAATAWTLGGIPAGPAQAATAACGSLQGLTLPGLTVTLTEEVAAGTPHPTPGQPALPAHCRMQGKLDERTGVDGKPYAIGFELRLPADWNGRFLFQGGGGNDGRIQPAVGRANTNALGEGFAIASTDAGHTAEPVPIVGDQLFGLDPQARIDYGYRAVQRVAEVAKRIIRRYYGDPAHHAYFDGCSNGGRQGMVASQRFPDLFDGIIAGAPGFNLPSAAVAQAWDTQALAAIAPRSGGRPVFSQALSDADLQLVAQGVLAACDARDGLEDGIVADTAGCRFDPSVLQCRSSATEGCLSAAKVGAIEKIFNGARNSQGRLLYATWPYDPGIAAPGWRVWKLGSSTTAMPDARNVVLGGPSLAYIFTTPPTRTTDPYRYLLNFDFDRDAPKIRATSGIFRQSAEEFMTAKSANLTRFRQSDGKLILYHGVSDPVFSADDTIRYHDRVRDRFGAETGDFVRLFLVPGMTHCGGGPATSQLNFLPAIVAWVEQDRAPQRVMATAPEGTPWPGRTRPLCPYPRYPRYDGTGSIEQAVNFVCR